MPHRGEEPLGGPRWARGTQLGKYTLLEPAGRGAMGTVWRASAQGFGGFERTVAIKLMGADSAHDPAARVLFMDEAELAARVRHPNVVATLDLGEWEGTLFVVQEWVEGAPAETLAHGEERIGCRMPESATLRLFVDALDGLRAVHAATDASGRPLELVHRDIAPDNLLMDASGWVRIADFGVARAARRKSEATVVGLVKGKAAFAAPEQQGLLPGVAVDSRADLWGLGATLFRLLTGRAPFARIDVLEDYVRGVGALPPLPHDVSPFWQSLLEGCMAPHPEGRFPSAEAAMAVVELAGKVHADAVPMGRSHLGAYVRERTERTHIDAAAGAAPDKRAERIVVVSGDPARAREVRERLADAGLEAGWERPDGLPLGGRLRAHVLVLSDLLDAMASVPRPPWTRTLRKALADDEATERVWVERPRTGPGSAQAIVAIEATLATYDTDRFQWVTLDARSAVMGSADGSAAALSVALSVALSGGDDFTRTVRGR